MRFASLLVIVAACGDPEITPPELCPNPSEPGIAPPPFEEAKFVAHAFGSPGGLRQDDIYSESREAFEASYWNGYRAYEVDLMLLADGEVAAVHDSYENHYGIEGKRFGEVTRAELEGRKYDGKYEVLFAEDVVQLVVEHPDVWLILDTKCAQHECDVRIAQTLVDLAPDDSVRDRFVPHLTGDAHVQALLEVHPFPERLYARYQWPNSDTAVQAKMSEYGIDDVMMFWDTQWSETLQSAMEGAGNHVWVHTPEEPAQIEEFVARGIGTYTNGFITCAP